MPNGSKPPKHGFEMQHRRARLTDSDTDSSPEDLVEHYDSGSMTVTTRRSSTQRARREWDRLQALLDGRTLDELRDELGRSVERFEAMTVPDDAARADLDDVGDDLDTADSRAAFRIAERRDSERPRRHPRCVSRPNVFVQFPKRRRNWSRHGRNSPVSRHSKQLSTEQRRSSRPPRSGYIVISLQCSRRRFENGSLT